MCEARCILCSNCLLETSNHLLFECRYALDAWAKVESILGCSIMAPKNTVQETWLMSWKAVKNRGSMSYRDWGARFTAVCWLIWKERNARIFRDTKTRADQLLAPRMVQLGELWLKFCNKQVVHV